MLSIAVKREKFGYYVVRMPILLLLAIRPSGCLNEDLLQRHSKENGLDLLNLQNFQLRLWIVMTYVYVIQCLCTSGSKTNLASNPVKVLALRSGCKNFRVDALQIP